MGSELQENLSKMIPIRGEDKQYTAFVAQKDKVNSNFCRKINTVLGSIKYVPSKLV